MKMKRLLINFAATLVLAGLVISFINAKQEQTYQERNNTSYDANGMIKWIKDRKVNPQTGEIDYDYVRKVEQQVKQSKALKSTNGLTLYWQEMGPDKVGGRTRSILVDKNNTNIIYSGAVSGGLWKSTNGGANWKKVNDNADNLSVTAICQTQDGTIYYGTGEKTGTGFIGNGIYKSTDGITFDNIAATNNFTYVNNLVAYNNTVYAATYKGLYRTTDGGENWEKVINANKAYDVAVSSTGKVLTYVGGKAYISNDGSNGSFQEITDLPSASVNGASLDIAPSNPDYMYASIALGTNNNPYGDESSLYDDFDIFRSTDGGATWESIRGEYYSANFQPFKRQSTYNNIIKVYPNNPNRVILGGIDLYEWTVDNGWSQVSYWVGDHEINQESYYCHADQHAITFHPNYESNHIIYFGNDGGFFYSKQDGYYIASNLGYNVTQFYKVDCGPTGKWIGGSQDNGSQFNDISGNNKLRTSQVLGGDGFDCELPELNKDLKIASLYYGEIYRITDKGQKQSLSTSSKSNLFHTQLKLWETLYDPMSIDSVEYVFEEIKHVGDTIYAQSNQGRKTIPYVLTADDLPQGDTIFPKEYILNVWDYYQAMLVTSGKDGTYITTRPINLSDVNVYYSKLNDIAEAENYAWTNNGDAVFFTKYNYSNGRTTIYRTSKILQAREKATNASGQLLYPRVTIVNGDKVETTNLGNVSGYVTSISVDPNSSNNVIITVGGYFTGNHVYYSNNAASTVSNNFSDNFRSINGDLPGMPVYSALIAWNDSRKAVIGTEYGVYVCNDITDSNPTWVNNNNNFPNVAVYSLVQQTFKNSWEYNVENHGYIYAGTFGRGTFMSKSNAGPVDVPEISDNTNLLNGINIYPNPAKVKTTVSFNMNKNQKVNITVYTLNGKVVKTAEFNALAGNNVYELNVNSYQKGVYFVAVSANNHKEVSKLIIK